MRAHVAAAALLVAGPLAASAGAAIALEPVGDFQAPTYVTAPPGDVTRLAVVERAGRVRMVVGGQVRATPYLDLTSLVGQGGEGGLLSLAFAPDYGATGRLYVFYTDRTPEHAIHVREYRRSADADRADPASGRNVITIPHADFDNHYGGQLQFGPDGLLYVSTGDGGSGGDPSDNAQRTDVLLGKILRIDPTGPAEDRYGSPPDNPYAGAAPGRDEIYATGLRNPWRFSFDRQGGAIVMGDVGQDGWEEIDHAAPGAAKGANFGWRRYEGTRLFGAGPALPGTRPPVFEYPHGSGACSVTGGYVVRDPAVPSLAGRYVFADYCGGPLRAIVPTEAQPRESALGVTVQNPVSFGEDACGRVYAVAQGGTVSRIVEAGSAGGPCQAAPGPPPTPAPGSPVGAPPGATRVLVGMSIPKRVALGGLLRRGVTGACSANVAGRCRVFAGVSRADARRLRLTGRLRDGMVAIGGGAADVTGAGAAAITVRLGSRARRSLGTSSPPGFALRLQIEVAAPSGGAVTVRRRVLVGA